MDLCIDQNINFIGVLICNVELMSFVIIIYGFILPFLSKTILFWINRLDLDLKRFVSTKISSAFVYVMREDI